MSESFLKSDEFISFLTRASFCLNTDMENTRHETDVAVLIAENAAATVWSTHSTRKGKERL